MPNVRKIPEYLQKMFEEELDEVPKRVPEDIKAIREWLKKQPHINARTDDQTILMFLRGCKFRLQVVKEKMEEYYALRSMIHERSGLRDPLEQDMQKVLDTPIVLPCPVNADGPQLYICRMCKGCYGRITVEEVLKTGVSILDIIMKDVDELLLGFYCIIDLEEFEYGYLTQIDMYLIKTLVRGLQHAYPVRLKGYLILNAPSVVVSLYETVKPLLFKKIRERFFFYNKNDLNELYKKVPKKLLPVEYGGCAGTMEEIRAEWKTRVENNRDWLMEDFKYGVDESKKINGYSKKFQEVEGSFRKLELD